jgi:hypothetical protein
MSDEQGRPAAITGSDASRCSLEAHAIGRAIPGQLAQSRVAIAPGLLVVVQSDGGLGCITPNESWSRAYGGDDASVTRLTATPPGGGVSG